jgi:hypothetical protein
VNCIKAEINAIAVPFSVKSEWDRLKAYDGQQGTAIVIGMSVGPRAGKPRD